MISFAKILGKKVKYSHKSILSLTKKEMLGYFKGQKLPNEPDLRKRDTGAVLLGDKSSLEFLTGFSVKKVEEIVTKEKDTSKIKGATAFKGRVEGVVRVVLDPKKANDFEIGEILVAGATRPEYLPIMKKAAAFVTDSGGILSHAAITAREMKKPCIIGTQIATKVLKDGDMVEVDADKGTVRKI